MNKCLGSQGAVIAFDLYLTPAGWDLQLFGRGSEGYRYLADLRNRLPLKNAMEFATPIDNDKRYSVKVWPIRTRIEEVCDDLAAWIDIIHAASKMA
jgi:hypothetical protein